MTPSDRIAVGAVGLIASVAICVAAWVLWPVPQIGPDDDVMRSVDALFTAITSKSEKRLELCRAKLQAHEQAGKLPPPAASRLTAIVRRAQGGEWQPAAEALYSFIKAQRREGAK